MLVGFPEDRGGAFNWLPMMPRDASLSDSCTSLRCCFTSRVPCKLCDLCLLYDPRFLHYIAIEIIVITYRVYTSSISIIYLYCVFPLFVYLYYLFILLLLFINIISQ